MSQIFNKKDNLHQDDLLYLNEQQMLFEFNNGKEIGEDAHISSIKDQFSWKRTFVNCWTGLPNFGKTTFLNFLTINKSVHDNWKWCIWSPEMVNSYKNKKTNKIYKSSSDIYDELIHTYTGLNPYKHLVKKYNMEQMNKDIYINAMDWVKEHFYIISPKENNYKTLVDSFKFWNDKYGFDGFIIDPFKNLQYDITGTMDTVLHKIFDELKEIAILTNSTINIIAHPKSNNEPKNPNGRFKVITQFNLLGGSAWDNSMDGIFSLDRPYMNLNPNDPSCVLYHLKQRKKLLVGRTGCSKDIEFDWRTNRYYFKEVCPIDGSTKEAINRDKKGNPILPSTNPVVQYPSSKKIIQEINFDKKIPVNYNNESINKEKAPF